MGTAAAHKPQRLWKYKGRRKIASRERGGWQNGIFCLKSSVKS
jgi:hypothetical protein